MIESSPDAGTFQVREAVADDAENLREFLAELFAERLPVMFRKDRPPTIEEERAVIEDFRSSPRSVFLVAVAGQKVVGALDFRGNTRDQRRHLGALGISVAKSWRRRGVATMLIHHLETWARANDFRRMELEVFENNPGAIKLYEKRGFVIEGRRKAAVEVDGTFIDAIGMAKLI